MKKLLLVVPLAASISLGACTTAGEDDTVESAATGAVVGGVAGAGLGAVVGGLSPITGAVIGAAVGGLAGAIWADRDNDGSADGYYYNGTYYQGEPPAAAPAPAPAYEPAPAPAYRAGERG